MRIADIPKFDASLFAQAELEKLQQLADACEDAAERPAIDAAGELLDGARRQRRELVRLDAARSHSLNALFKKLLHEVPRPPIQKEEVPA